jgi:hypothetical protein
MAEIVSTNNEEREISEKTAWPAAPIETYQSIESGEWGYLIYYKGETIPEFSNKEKPSDQEILDRWGSEIQKNYEKAQKKQ